MRKNFGAKPWTYPQPVFILATYDENGVPDAMNAAWGGISDDKELTMCISASHKTTANILARKAFTVSMATAEQVVACDYVGIESGKRVPDKLEKTGWHLIRAEFVDAPLVEELPNVLCPSSPSFRIRYVVYPRSFNMDAAEFANKFAAKSLDYDAFEYSELINVIKGCDDQLRTTFFRNATAINLSDLCKEIAVKTVCYTIAKIPAYNFNQCIKDIDYKTAIGSLLLGNETLNTWVVKRFIESIVDSETLTDEFKNAIFKIITASGYVWGTTNEISTGNRQKAILLFDFVKIYYPEEKYAEFYDIYYKENAVATEFIAQTDPFFSYLGDDRLSRGIKADVEEAINKQTNVRD